MELVRHRLASATQAVTICPIGDIQWSGDEEDLAYDHLLAHIATCKKMPTPLFVGTGDAIDFASPSNRDRLLQAKLYDTAQKVIADAGKRLVDDLVARVLKPTIGHWLGWAQGHHHHQVVLSKRKDGSVVTEDSDVYLAKLLKARFLDEFGFIELAWPGGGKFRLVVWHGKGSSVFPWGPLTTMWRLVPNFQADLFVMGHTTKKAMAETDRLLFPEHGDSVTHQTIKMVGAGGWTKGYVPGRRTYISEAALSPVALGQPLIHLRPRFRGKTWEPGMTVEV